MLQFFKMMIIYFQKLHKIHLSNEEKFVTLNDIIEFELNEENKVGIDALLWLKRYAIFCRLHKSCMLISF